MLRAMRNLGLLGHVSEREKLAHFDTADGASIAVRVMGPPPTRDAPAVVLCHGFPELAYSWRHQMDPLADAVEFDWAAAEESIQRVRPGMQVIRVSTKTGVPPAKRTISLNETQ